MNVHLAITPYIRCLGFRPARAAIIAMLLPLSAIATSVQFNTEPYWGTYQGILGGLGPGQSSTIGETFVAPTGGSVILQDFSFVAQSYYPSGSSANLELQAFIYSWSGGLRGQGGGAVGGALYLGPTFEYSPPPRAQGWAPLTANLGSGVPLTPGGHYVIGFTLSNPANYSASQGDIEFQEVSTRGSYPTLPASVDGGGGAVWDNNGSNFGALNTTTWDTWGDTGDMSFTADFSVPDSGGTTLYILAAGALMAFAKFCWPDKCCS